VARAMEKIGFLTTFEYVIFSKMAWCNEGLTVVCNIVAQCSFVCRLWISSLRQKMDIMKSMTLSRCMGCGQFMIPYV